MKNIITGLDVGTAVISTVVAERAKGEVAPRILGIGKMPSQGMRRGYVVDFDDVVAGIRASVKEAERSAGVSIRRVYVSMGGISLGAFRSKGMIAVSRADGEITEYDVKRVLSQSEANLPNITNREILHAIPLNFTIDNDLKTPRPVGMKGGRLEVETLFLICLAQHLSDIIKSVEAAGLSVDDVVAAPLAAARAILTKRQKEMGVLLVDVGAGTVSVVVFEEGIPISLEVFPIGSGHITNDIALGLQIPLEEAESLKLSYGSDASSRRKLTDIIEARLGDIFELVDAHLKKIKRTALLPAGIVLSGGGSNLVSIAEFAKNSLKLPVTIGYPNFLKENRVQYREPDLAVAVGLCLLGFDEDINPPIGGMAIARRTKFALLRWLRSFLP